MYHQIHTLPLSLVWALVSDLPHGRCQICSYSPNGMPWIQTIWYFHLYHPSTRQDQLISTSFFQWSQNYHYNEVKNGQGNSLSGTYICELSKIPTLQQFTTKYEIEYRRCMIIPQPHHLTNFWFHFNIQCRWAQIV